jgi:hypothetical protein
VVKGDVAGVGVVDPNAIGKAGQQVGLCKVSDGVSEGEDRTIGWGRLGEDMRLGRQQKYAEPAGVERNETLDWGTVAHGLKQQFF